MARGDDKYTPEEQAAIDAAGLAAQKNSPTTNAAQVALTKLTSGQTLTPTEKAILNIGPVAPAEPAVISTPTRVETNQAKKDAGPPYEAPAGSHWTWVGTEYKLYKDLPQGASGGSTGGNTGSGAGAGTGTGTGSTVVPDPYTQYLADQKKAEGVSAYNLLLNEFNAYGLGSLVSDIKDLLVNNTPPSEMALILQQTPAYQARFSANKNRIAAGLSALKPSEYIALEDQYQNVMRNYGLPASYYTPDSTGKQPGFDKLIANDVSASELENRLITAQDRVLKSNPEVLQALKQFYPGISNGDILAYSLDPKNALKDIQQKVSAAEIGGAALAQGLQTNGVTAEQLAAQGITKAQAQQGYIDVAQMAPRGSQLADIYGQQPYNQATAEAEVFNTAGAAQAAAQRKKLTALETASFSGQSGVGALGRDKAAYGLTYGQNGLY